MPSPTVQEQTRPSPLPRIAAAGFCTVVASIGLFLSLDAHAIVVTGSRLESTISAYGLGSGRWIFTIAVLLLAAGSAALLVALVGRRLARWRSGAALAMALWIVGLVVLAIFPKQDWSQPESLSGSIHRAASALAFVSLPAAAVLLARPWLRHRSHAVHARRTLASGALAVASLTPLFYAIGVAIATEAKWWNVIALGHSERVLALSEVAILVVIGAWALART
ncbi:DUF998 domain-containing protein [Rhodococcus koreensis]|uniref:DUF998 domain-containing protein n=1 Tax=Rhodococcus koreensis TaxID=99653 RepID=UPI0036722A34